MKKNISSISVDAFCYPTENKQHVLSALHTIINIENAELKENKIESHYGPEIIQIKFKTTRPKEIQTLIDHIEQHAKINDAIDRVDEEGFLHLRFDKQAASQGEIKLTAGGDIIKVKIRLVSYPFNVQEVKKTAKELFA